MLAYKYQVQERFVYQMECSKFFKNIMYAWFCAILDFMINFNFCIFKMFAL